MRETACAFAAGAAFAGGGCGRVLRAQFRARTPAVFFPPSEMPPHSGAFGKTWVGQVEGGDTLRAPRLPVMAIIPRTSCDLRPSVYFLHPLSIRYTKVQGP